jgi:ABC-type sugar transport system ATPase subunit
MGAELLKLAGISKSFASNRVLDSVSIDIERGKCYAVVGENGAGKSTLMKVIGGLYHPEEGRIFLEGQEVKFAGPGDAIRAGISIVHQELSLASNLTVAQNIFCHREKTNAFGFIQWKQLYAEAKGIFGTMGVEIDPRALCGRLSVGLQQIVEIAKALSLNSKIIIMDEPTSALSEKEVDHLYRIVDNLKKRNVAVIFISHKLTEVFRIAERIFILRDGKLTGDLKIDETDRDEVISLMVGRHITDLYPPKSTGRGEDFFSVSGLSRKGVFEGVGFALRRKEILGFAGLVGAGRTETARAIFGADPKDSGEIVLEGKLLTIRNPMDAIAEGVCYLTEDRKNLGLFLSMPMRFNIVAASLGKFVNRLGFYLFGKIKSHSLKYVDLMQIRPFDDEIKVLNLSGGNQQKTLLGKWLCAEPKVLIVDEPTRGVDIGAKANIHQDLRKLAEKGVGVIVISSELPEIFGLCDRIAVFCEGRITKILENEDLTQEEIMKYATK